MCYQSILLKENQSRLDKDLKFWINYDRYTKKKVINNFLKEILGMFDMYRASIKSLSFS